MSGSFAIFPPVQNVTVRLRWRVRVGLHIETIVDIVDNALHLTCVPTLVGLLTITALEIILLTNDLSGVEAQDLLILAFIYHSVLVPR